MGVEGMTPTRQESTALDRMPVRETRVEEVTRVAPGIPVLLWRAGTAFPLTGFLTTVLVFVLGVVLLAYFPKSYTARAIVTPPAELDRLNLQSGLSGSGSSLSMAGGLGGLLGGGAVQSASQVRYETFVTLLTSRRIAQQLIRKHDVLKLIYPKLWDPANNSWKKPHGLIFHWRERLAVALGYPGWIPPDATTLATYLAGHIQVSQSLKTSQRTFALTARDPDLAVELLTWTMAEADAAVRADALERARAQLDYVEGELGKSITNSEDRVVLSEILMGTQRSMVLASTGSTFSNQIIQDPEASDSPSSPKLVPTLFGILILSVIAGFGAAVLRYRSRPGARRR